MNPYEADPEKIPSTDRYADVPMYGRYLPRSADFTPDAKHINCTTPESLEYWSTVLDKCTESNRIYENQDGGRDVFALGSVIVKSSHLKAIRQGRRSHRDYSYADANEVEAIAIARKVLGSVKVPRVYFAAKVNGRDVFVQERIPGKLRTASLPAEISRRSYVIPDPDPVEHRGIQELERDIIFSEDNKDPDLSFMHNDFSQSNCIVDNDRIVGLFDWEMAGFFGWKTAGKVHDQIRTPKRENYSSANVSEEKLSDILFWNDLYE
ncbi:hypothetical protein CC80DRAFT_597743 [Byssothecium circinans]|uniref:Aminoglycoside phosphotransferase domain-containing protein n=1 Tax=Byssothecium circinans TaxID=147558 RepID=A0A6A5TH91_9PLEO|nr:hypothetical protein CC80DRAFT_597743 [Byssothecium circinans]